MAARVEPTHRRAGIMMPLASLPSNYGVGDMGAQAYAFLNLLRSSGGRYWQILPINPLGFGNSPYQPYSSYAGDPLFISLEQLWQEGLLDAVPPSFQPEARRIHYQQAREYKERYLRKAFSRFIPTEDYQKFIKRAWVHPYGVFMAFKRANRLLQWTQWPEALKNWPVAPQGVDLSPYQEDIRYEMFVQYHFYTQWMRLKAHANGLGVEIIGDIPIYVGLDSQDVWMERENFCLAENGEASLVAGVPPDYFSQTGQRWGNPVYHWEHLEATGFDFWVRRFECCAELFDVVRIDHFRGFDTYWEIPASCPTAQVGQWKEAPGYALFDTVLKHLPELRVVAEDLGMLRQEVYQLRDQYHFPGMEIVQFFFDPGKPIRPKAGRSNAVIYTGTHDNQTMLGWYRSQPSLRRIRIRCSLWRAGYRQSRVVQRFVQMALDDAAWMAVIPMFDVLGLDDRARINTPGTVGSPNWEWKMASLQPLEKALPAFSKAIQSSGRGDEE